MHIHGPSTFIFGLAKERASSVAEDLTHQEVVALRPLVYRCGWVAGEMRLDVRRRIDSLTAAHSWYDAGAQGGT